MHIRFCLKLGNRKRITVKEFEKINWPPIHESVSQYMLSYIYKFHTKKVPDYMGEIFLHAECNGIPIRYSYQKLKLSHRKANQGWRALSYIGPLLWNNQDKSLKTFAFLNTLKHNIKDFCFWKGNKKES